MHKLAHKRPRNRRTNAQERHTSDHAQMPLYDSRGHVCVHPIRTSVQFPGCDKPFRDREAYLVSYPPRVSNGWETFKALAGWGEAGRKYTLAWNGQRFARSGELARVAKAFPKQLEALTEWLEAGRP